MKKTGYAKLILTTLLSSLILAGCGEAGAQGPQGEQGPKGETGEQGPKGETGAQGPKGDQGVSVVSADVVTETDFLGNKKEYLIVKFSDGSEQKVLVEEAFGSETFYRFSERIIPIPTTDGSFPKNLYCYIDFKDFGDCSSNVSLPFKLEEKNIANEVDWSACGYKTVWCNINDRFGLVCFYSYDPAVDKILRSEPEILTPFIPVQEEGVIPEIYLNALNVSNNYETIKVPESYLMGIDFTTPSTDFFDKSFDFEYISAEFGEPVTQEIEFTIYDPNVLQEKIYSISLSTDYAEPTIYVDIDTTDDVIANDKKFGFNIATREFSSFGYSIKHEMRIDGLVNGRPLTLDDFTEESIENCRNSIVNKGDICCLELKQNPHYKVEFVGFDPSDLVVNQWQHSVNPVLLAKENGSYVIKEDTFVSYTDSSDNFKYIVPFTMEDFNQRNPELDTTEKLDQLQIGVHYSIQLEEDFSKGMYIVEDMGKRGNFEPLYEFLVKQETNEIPEILASYYYCNTYKSGEQRFCSIYETYYINLRKFTKEDVNEEESNYHVDKVYFNNVISFNIDDAIVSETMYSLEPNKLSSFNFDFVDHLDQEDLTGYDTMMMPTGIKNDIILEEICSYYASTDEEVFQIKPENVLIECYDPYNTGYAQQIPIYYDYGVFYYQVMNDSFFTPTTFVGMLDVSTFNEENLGPAFDGIGFYDELYPEECGFDNKSLCLNNYDANISVSYLSDNRIGLNLNWSCTIILAYTVSEVEIDGEMVNMISLSQVQHNEKDIVKVCSFEKDYGEETFVFFNDGTYLVQDVYSDGTSDTSWLMQYYTYGENIFYLPNIGSIYFDGNVYSWMSDYRY